MNDFGLTRVAVYIDFDNIVISRYDQVHGRGQFQRDKVRGFDRADRSADPDIAEKLRRATVDVRCDDRLRLIVRHARADPRLCGLVGTRERRLSWPAHQPRGGPGSALSPAAYTKNGADIRLAVDAVEDMFRLPDLTHVVIVAGDSDYIALAQRCRRLGRYVVGVGVAGSTSRSLAAACDELVTYDALPGITPADAPRSQPRARPARWRNSRSPAARRPRGARGVQAIGGRGERRSRSRVRRSAESWRPDCSYGRCGSARKRTTRTGCTVPR